MKDSYTKNTSVSPAISSLNLTIGSYQKKKIVLLFDALFSDCVWKTDTEDQVLSRFTFDAFLKSELKCLTVLLAIIDSVQVNFFAVL